MKQQEGDFVRSDEAGQQGRFSYKVRRSQTGNYIAYYKEPRCSRRAIG